MISTNVVPPSVAMWRPLLDPGGEPPVSLRPPQSWPALPPQAIPSLARSTPTAPDVGSKTFKPRLLRDYSGCCVCSNQYLLHVAHVFDKAADIEFRSNCTRGLTNLDSLNSYDNAIHLCAADHGAYDAPNPLFVIVPRYIKFLFEKERNWQHEMEKSPRPLAHPSVPASTYAKFCEEEHGKRIGALYTAYPLVDYKLPGTGPRRSVVAREKNTPHGFVGGARATEHKKTSA
jgi:hypothetical protein